MNPPPLLISFESAEQILQAMPEDLYVRYGAECSALIERQLPPAVSTRVVAILFGYSTKFVGSLVNAPQRHYRVFRIPKGRGHRSIYAPRVALKLIQKWIGFHLERSIEWPDYVCGFVTGRSHLTAAKAHAGANWVFSVDIENFFPSVSRYRARHALESIGYSSHAAEIVAALACVNGALAQGSPASPVIANLTLSQLDVQLSDLASELGFRYTRYADDLVFSGVDAPPSEGFKSRVREMVRVDGWRLAGNKEYFAIRPKRLKVHGLLVDTATPRLTRGYRNKLRAYEHLLANGRVLEVDIPRLQGHVEYGNSVKRFFSDDS